MICRLSVYVTYSDVDEYVDKGGIAASILDNSNSPVEFAAAVSSIHPPLI